MAAQRPTVRTLAASLGLSRATVSNALRALPTVKPATRDRVLAEARARGYVAHPFASEVMSQLRRSSKSRQVGTLAILEMDEPGRPPGATGFNLKLCEGIRSRAAQIGFSVSHWKFGEAGGLPLRRLSQILQWRGVHGFLLLPTWGEPDVAGLDWSQITGIYLDYLIRHPPLHTVSSDHYRTAFTALEQARAMGYRRPGLAIPQRANARLNGRWIASYLGYMHDHPGMERLPPLIEDEIRPENFRPWFREHRPDVVISHWVGAPREMAACGARLPRTHGFICLNVLHAEPGVSGFDLQPGLLGARATELVVSQLAQRERGIPPAPSNTLVPSAWVPGTTVRAQN